MNALFEKAQAAIESLPDGCKIVSVSMFNKERPWIQVYIYRSDFEKVFAGKEVKSGEWNMEFKVDDILTICCRQPTVLRRQDENITLPALAEA